MAITTQQHEKMNQMILEKIEEKRLNELLKSNQDNHKTERIRTQNEISKLRKELKKFKPSDLLKWTAITLLICEALGLLTISDIELLRVILNFI